MSDQVNHPKHYSQFENSPECIDVIGDLNYVVGNALKYMWRHDHKCNAIEDLEKAIWYIECHTKKLKIEKPVKKYSHSDYDEAHDYIAPIVENMPYNVGAAFLLVYMHPFSMSYVYDMGRAVYLLKRQILIISK